MLKELKEDVDKVTKLMFEQHGNFDKDRKPKMKPKRNFAA